MSHMAVSKGNNKGIALIAIYLVMMRMPPRKTAGAMAKIKSRKLNPPPEAGNLPVQPEVYEPFP